MVDANFAHRFWPHGDAIGQRVAVDAIPDVEPAGRALAHHRRRGRAREALRARTSKAANTIYFPHQQPLYGVFVPRDMTLAVRTSLDPAGVTSAIREQVVGIDKDLALYNIATMDQLVSTSVAQPRLNLSLLVAFATLALCCGRRCVRRDGLRRHAAHA